MAAALDLEARLVGQASGGTSRPSAARSARPPATSSRASASAAAAIARGRATAQRGQLLEMRGFGGERVRAGLAHPDRLLVQVGRVEADHAGQGLAVGEAQSAAISLSACRAGTSI